MSQHARHLLDEALRLSVADRAELAAELPASIDGAADVDAEPATTAEIERRAHRALRGESVGRDANVALVEIEERLRGG